MLCMVASSIWHGIISFFLSVHIIITFLSVDSDRISIYFSPLIRYLRAFLILIH